MILCVIVGLLTIPFVNVANAADDDRTEWTVTFSGTTEADGHWSYDFTPDQMAKVFSEIQPGDDIFLTVHIKNQFGKDGQALNWYMTNQVLKTLEETFKDAPDGGTNGGAYTYILTYIAPNGAVEEIYNSDTVGGEYQSDREIVSGEDEGLKEATDSLEDYFYLDTLTKGEEASVTLEIALEGESQGNAYQDTLAQLQMNFAVELTDETPERTSTPLPSTTPSTTTSATPRPNRSTTPRSSGTSTSAVRTGERSLVPYIIIAAVSGLLLLVFAVYSQRARRKNKKE